MKVLLDTNILIYRESIIPMNYSIGHLFRWLDRLHFEKIVHPVSIKEIEKYNDPTVREAFKIKLSSYELLKVNDRLDKTICEKFKTRCF